MFLGYAFSGGGNKVWRVDLTIDGGKTWMEATLNHPEGSPEPPRHWAWTLWTAKIPVPRGVQQVEIWSKVMFIFNPRCKKDDIDSQPRLDGSVVKATPNLKWYWATSCLIY